MPFKSEKQVRYFYWKAKKSSKWKKMAKEWSSHTDFSSLPKKASNKLRKKYAKRK